MRYNPNALFKGYNVEDIIQLVDCCCCEMPLKLDPKYDPDDPDKALNVIVVPKVAEWVQPCFTGFEFTTFPGYYGRALSFLCRECLDKGLKPTYAVKFKETNADDIHYIAVKSLKDYHRSQEKCVLN